MIPQLLLTNNSTLAYEDGGAGGTATGAGALRYRDGYFAGSSAALVEEGTTNSVRSPYRSPGWAFSTVDPLPSSPPGLPWITSGAVDAGPGGASRTLNTYSEVTGKPVGTPVAVSMYTLGTAGDQFRLSITMEGGATPFATSATQVPLSGSWQHIVHTSEVDQPDRTSLRGDIQLTNIAANDVYITAQQLEYSKDHATTPCPELDGSGNLLPGYAWTGTANNSPSTRAAASITIPYSGTVGSLACWYSEDFGATWSWHYAEALGSIGTYGDIADDGSGNLVITSDRALLLGPLAVWTDTLSAGQQAGVQAYSDVWTWADISSVPVTLDTAMTAAGTSAATLGSAVTLATAGTAAGTSTATMSATLARLLDTSMLAAGSSTATLGTTLDLLTAMVAAGTSTAVMHPEAGPVPLFGGVLVTLGTDTIAVQVTPGTDPIAVQVTAGDT